MAFLLYMVGFIVFVSGLAWIATLAGASQTVVVIGALVLLGIGVFFAAARMRFRHPA
jgi:positive regulator of sigma E activity